MILFGPNYLSTKTLPFVSDIFYHKKIIYSLPTGFIPTEIESVIEFPYYCNKNSIALPTIIWEMCEQYLLNSKEAFEGYNILLPLKKDFIEIIQFSYARDRNTIHESIIFLDNHPELLESFKITLADMPFISRELLSHILFEIVIQEGYKGAIEYIRENSKSYNDFNLLMAATIINRLKIFEADSINLLMFNNNWGPFIDSYLKLKKTNSKFHKENLDNDIIENVKYKLFQEIITPIFGMCDTKQKSKVISRIANKKQDAINDLKEKCKLIAIDTLFLSTDDFQFKQSKLINMLEDNILEPLSYLVEKPTKDTKCLISDFLFDSTLIGGILTFSQNINTNILGKSIALAAFSTGTKYLFNEKLLKIEKPNNLLLEGLNKMKVKYIDYENQIRNIEFKNLI